MIPFVDLKTQYLSIKDEVNAAIQGVLESCQFTLGSEVAKFEDEFAAHSGAKIGIGITGFGITWWILGVILRTIEKK